MISVGTGQPSAYFPLRINNNSQAQETNSVVPVRFPSTRNVLWESKPVGDFETLALILDKQVVQLFIVEKSLRLAQRYAEDRRLTSFLLGSVYPKSGGSGVCFGVDRFDPGREITEKIGENVIKSKVPTAVVPGDHIIPITVQHELLTADDSISHTKDEFTRAIQVMEDKICGKDVLTLSHIVALKANLYCCRKQDELILALHCGAIVPDSKFQVRPIAPLPIIPTTLARNLAGPLRLSDVEGTPKMGYVTMDQTRKLLLLLESDPKAYNLPLIGIWISGVQNVHHPYVWASCLRYLNCREIKDRVFHSSGSFLLLHYSIMQKIPDFWECYLDNKELDFELLSCQENLHLDLDDYSSKEPLCFHLTPSPNTMNKNLFDEAIAEWKKDRHTLRNIKESVDVDQNNCYSKLTGFKNDENPRPFPSPRPSPTQVKSPNAPAQEESLSLSFDEGSSNFINKHSEQTRGSTKTLAPRFKQTPNPAKPVPNKSDSFKHSRQPFKQITPQDEGNSPNNFLSRGKPVLASRNRENRKGEDKENTPLTSRSIPLQGNLNQKSLSGGTREITVPFCENNNNVSRRQSVGSHPQKALSDQKFSNPRVPVKVRQFGKRKRYNSEEVQTYEVQQLDELHQIRRNSHSSLALSDDDDLNNISLDSSFTKNNEMRCLSNHSPSNQFNQVSSNHLSEQRPSNFEYSPGLSKQSRPYSDFVSDQPSKSDSGSRNRQSPRDDVKHRNQSNANTRQNSPKVSGSEQQSSSSPQFNNRQTPVVISKKPERRCSSDGNLQQINPDSSQFKGIISNSGRRSFAGRSFQHANRDTAQEQQQPLLKNSDNCTQVVYHDGNLHLGNNLIQGDSSPTVYTSNNRMPIDQPSDNQPVVFAKSVEMTSQCYDTDGSRTKYGDRMNASACNNGSTMQQSSETCTKIDNESSTKHKNKKSPLKMPTEGSSAASYHQKSDKNPVQQQSPNICNDTTHHISSNRITNHHGNSQQMPTYGNHASQRSTAVLTLTPSESEMKNVEAQENTQDVVELKKEYLEKLASSKQLEEQVKKQEDMLRVLQEQVRSLLKIKDAMSSEDDRSPLPLTPAATPVSTHENGEELIHKASPETQEGQNTSEAVREPERVTIGVNTGASLLWETPRDGCQKCCKCKKSEAEQIRQVSLDNIQPYVEEHSDVFPTPEKTESLISPSQVHVQTDSTCNSTPAISNMIISSMSPDDGTLLSDQAESTSQASADKGREFYDKLLYQVKDLLSEQVSTKQDDSTKQSQQTAEVPTREVVVKATLKQLEKMKHSEPDGLQQLSGRLETESSSVFSTHRRSLSTSFIPEHARLNYMSMSVDDTFDEVTYIDEVALKYLSDEELKQFKSELRPSAVKRSFTRTVRFGSLPSDNERRSVSRRSLREVDFTWNNLSFCTKNYLTKYNLVEGHVSFTGDGQASTSHENENSPESSILPCKPPFPSPARHHSQQSSDILDIKRLKNLPKLF